MEEERGRLLWRQLAVAAALHFPAEAHGAR